MNDREKYPSEAAERFQVRMPLGLRDRIKAALDEAEGPVYEHSRLCVLCFERFPEPTSADMQPRHQLEPTLERLVASMTKRREFVLSPQSVMR